jgi:hypothetical protein
LFAASCLTLLASCGSSGARSSGVLPGASTGGAAPGDAGPDSADLELVPAMLAFSPANTVKLGVKETRELTVLATPPASFRVRFALLGYGSDSAPDDAVLDTSEVLTAPDGIARVTLTAPSTPTTFSVRASVGNKQTLIGASVSMRGYTTLRVLPSYSGQRRVERFTWTATAHTGASCAKLSGIPPPDGPLSVTAGPTGALNIEQVPIGLDLAVTVRAGHYVGGCANQAPLSEGDGNSVLVYASDRPLNLDQTALNLSFGPSDPRPAFDQLMKSSLSLAESALSGTATSDVGALLDEMHDATPAENQIEFNTTRQQSHWDLALETAFGKTAARRLRDPAQRWLSAGLSALGAPGAFAGQLAAQGHNALFTLSQVANVAPADAGFPSSFKTTWSADSSDTVLLGSELTWLPSRLVTALAVAPALLEFPEALSVEEALARSVDCQLVSQVLIAASPSPSSAAYANCEQSCVLSSCTSGIASAWNKARDASGTAIATLSVTATGAANVGDSAEATGLNGSWLGELRMGEETALASGALSATN